MTNVALGIDSLVRNKSVSISDIIDQNDKSWDLEYYVHYLVKWKGMQVSQVTWEYWKDIKQYYVDTAY